MRYRKLGRTELEISEISIGTEWLEKKSPEEITAVLSKAVEYGVNYFDVIFNIPEHIEKVSKAIEGKRDKIVLSHHLGSNYKGNKYMKTRSIKKCTETFENYLKVMKTDYVDLLFVHFVMHQKQYEEILKPNGVLELALKLKEEGKARYVGISTHSAKVAIRAAESGKFDVIMIQVNLASNAMPLRNEMLSTSAKNGVGIIAMKPFGGGTLLQAGRKIDMGGYKVGGYTTILSDSKMSKKMISNDTSAPKCLHYVLSQIGVTAAVPGVASIEELDDCMRYFNLSEEELDYSNLLKEFDEYVTGVCVYCNHCQPCPSEIDIGRIIRLYDLSQIEMKEDYKHQYKAFEAKASDCTECGDCLERCPFDVQVTEIMKEIVTQFE